MHARTHTHIYGHQPLTENAEEEEGRKEDRHSEGLGDVVQPASTPLLPTQRLHEGTRKHCSVPENQAGMSTIWAQFSHFEAKSDGKVGTESDG